MKRIKDSIKSMLISIFISGAIIFLCESNSLNLIRQEVIHLYPFLKGKESIISNIFIGILCSSVIALIGYIFEYKSESEKFVTKTLYYYQYVRFNILPGLGKETKTEIYKVNRYDKNILEIRTFLMEDDNFLSNCIKVEKFLNIFSKYKYDDIIILTSEIYSEYVKAMCVFKIVCDYYSAVSSSYYRIDEWTKEREEIIEELNNKGPYYDRIFDDIKMCSDNIKKYSDKIDSWKNKILKWKLIDRCKNLDLLFGLFSD